MKKIPFILFLLLVEQCLYAQRKEINSTKDMPVATYSTWGLKPGDSVSTDAWIKSKAASELKHADSILNNYAIDNIRATYLLIIKKLYCNFILGNWQQLSHADTAYRVLKLMPQSFQTAGRSELAAYARAMLQPGKDFNKSFIAFYAQLMAPLPADEKIAYTGQVGYWFRGPVDNFNDAVKKISSHLTVGDTSLYGLFSTYVACRFVNRGIPELLTNYTNKLVAGKFTRADTLRGTLNAERTWWNVLRYDITVKPDFNAKSIAGKNVIKYAVLNDDHPEVMQIDLQEPLRIDSILFNNGQKLKFTKDGNAWHVNVPQQQKPAINSLSVYYHGFPHAAVNPPWDGGWIFKRDSLGNPWMSVACQGIGASIWYPCKDHQSDEPDNGASLSIIVPDSLNAVANGRLQSKIDNKNGTTTYKWAVVSPINNYDIVPYIGKYMNVHEVYKGLKGDLDVNYWLLPYNLAKAKAHMFPEVHRMLKAHEYWFGPYPFYEDGYKIVDAPYEGMENQTDIAYGNGYQNGQEGYDASERGWGMKWDLIIVHESAHEWFGNNITSNDIADMWIHESFGNYSETLFTEYWYGKAAGNDYNVGTRHSIQNNFPVIAYYGVNDQLDARSGDMYPKGGNMLQAIRHSINDDEKFRMILHGLGATFYHQTVNTAQIENYISRQAGFDYSKVFDQYLRTTQIPKLEFYVNSDGGSASYRYSNCIAGFNLPLVLKSAADSIKIYPNAAWKTTPVTSTQAALFDKKAIENMYYIDVKMVAKKDN
jgi:hypothetical protein